MSKSKSPLFILVVILCIGVILLFFSLNSKFQLTGKSTSDEEIQTDFASIAIVSKVIDGDTVIINGESVRLLGADTDERGYPCYTLAKKRIEELVLGKEVSLETDTEDKDQYGRYLRFIFLNNTNINLQLVKEGYAVARFSAENKKYKEEILAAQEYAIKNKIGCKWGAVLEDNNSNITLPNILINSSEYNCSSNIYNCADFKTQGEAQALFDYCGGTDNDIHGLDKNKDGVVCSSLPK